MKIEKFKSIIKYNEHNAEENLVCVRLIYEYMGMNHEAEALNLLEIVRTTLRKKGYLLIEMPFSDKEIGAICYKGNGRGYVVLNSSLPKVNVNFALCHELYHIFFQKRPMKHAIELYMNDHYFDDEEELAANAFAGNLLMPASNFKKMYYKFSKECSKQDFEIEIIAKLMNYYEAPYMAVVIRCYGLKLLGGGEKLKRLLDSEEVDIRKEFTKLWLNEKILEPTMRDDFDKFESLVRNTGKEMEREEIISGKEVETALQNMRKIYKEIKGEA